LDSERYKSNNANNFNVISVYILQVIELFYFAMMAVIFMFAYGVAVQSLLYPNSEDNGGHILYRVFYYPYLSMFQDFEYHLEELEGTQL